MHKLFVILSCVVFCLLSAVCGEREGGVSSGEPIASDEAVLSVDHTAGSELFCEYEYNSDLNLPRVGGEVSSPVTVPAQVRGASSDNARVWVRYASLVRSTEVARTASVYTPFDPIAGPHAVEFYVYRLRRLLI